MGAGVKGVVRSTGRVRHCLEVKGKSRDGEKQLPWVFAVFFQWIPRPLGTILALGDFHPVLIPAQADSGLPEEVFFHSQ